MTEQELANKFTDPDPNLASIRKVLVSQAEARIRHLNEEANMLGNAEDPRVRDLVSRRNECAYWSYKLRSMITEDGRILKALRGLRRGDLDDQWDPVKLRDPHHPDWKVDTNHRVCLNG